jgi:hypothetical protein
MPASFVIPAKAGIQFFLSVRQTDENWMPAFAGMTTHFPPPRE